MAIKQCDCGVKFSIEHYGIICPLSHPLDDALLEAMRVNFIELKEWIGEGNKIDKEHDNDGVGYVNRHREDSVLIEEF